MKVFEQAVEFIKALTRAENVEKEQRLREDLNMSEEDVMEVILDLEECYSLDDLTLEEFEKIETVENLVEVMESKMKPPAGKEEPKKEEEIVPDDTKPKTEEEE